MEPLHIRLLGALEVRRGGVPLPPVSGAGPRSLFAFLLLEPGRVYPRDVLCGVLWGERTDDTARKALRNGLWRLRGALGDDGAAVLRVEGDQVGLDPGRVRVDLQAFEAATAFLASDAGGDILDDERADRLAAAVDLYRGDLLDGFYEDWCLAPRERLRLRFLAALERLVRHHRARGEPAPAVARARLLLHHDPLREHMHREVMAAHWAMGDRPSALRQFAVCRRLLREELDIEPMEETRQLHDRIRAGKASTPPSLTRPTRRAAPGSVARTLEGALADLYAAADVLERLRDEGPEERAED